MACYHPIPAMKTATGDVILWPKRTQRRGLRDQSNDDLALPCGTCIGCKSARATQWAHRCEHEASYHTDNIFLNLTYDDENLPHAGHLDPRALCLFIKRLRKSAQCTDNHMRTDEHQRIRYFACGEYGERNHRPHYHAIIFGCTFTDRYTVGAGKRGEPLYESDTLHSLWTAGLARFGDATPAAANYIAQYTLKKQRRSRRDDETEGYADEDGVWIPKPEPFLRMSLKPGIGVHWLTQYGNDLVHGYLVQNGQKHAIPRAYKTKLQKTDSGLAETIEHNAYLHRRESPTDNSPERLEAGELIHTRYKQLTEDRKL